MNNFVVEAKGPVQVDIQDAPDLSLSDMLEIAAMGGNGVEYININNLMEKAATRIRELETQIADMRLQAQSWAAEAKTQRATVHEALQAASGATGEKGDWNGAKPIKEALAAAEAAGVAKGLEMAVNYCRDCAKNFESISASATDQRTAAFSFNQKLTWEGAAENIAALSPPTGMVLVPREKLQRLIDYTVNPTPTNMDDRKALDWVNGQACAMLGAARE